jgi:hypothetical protein
VLPGGVKMILIATPNGIFFGAIVASAPMERSHKNNSRRRSGRGCDAVVDVGRSARTNRI